MTLSSNAMRRTILAISLAVAYLGFDIPSRQMPRDYHAMLTISIPLSFLWTFLFAAYLWRYRRQGLWAILGAPLAFWWPIWLLINGLPSCYYTHNCV